MKKPQQIYRHNERGAVLAISLIILLLLTIIGISSMQTTTMEEKMAGNSRDMNLAFQAAEAALRDGEIFLNSATLPNFDGTNGLYQPAALTDDPLWQTVNWSSGARAYSGTLPYVNSQPTYIIEELSAMAGDGGLTADEPESELKYYRVSSRGEGATSKAVVILQSVYRR